MGNKQRTPDEIKFDRKVADIINMAGFPMAILEINDNEDEVFCTENIAKFFSVELPEWNDNYVSKDALVKALLPCKKNLFPEYKEPNVFRYVLENNGRRWISIKEKKTATGMFYVMMDVTENIRERRKIRRDRDFDVLTGLYTRRALQRKMESLLGERNVRKGVFSLWDLDNLKYVNDTYGHETGDKYICALGALFHSLKTGDKIASRLGGDEFVLVFHSDEPEVLIEKIKEIHEQMCDERIKLPDGSYMNVSASVGVSIFKPEGNNYEDLFREADDAMYEMKRTTKGKVNVAG